MARRYKQERHLYYKCKCTVPVAAHIAKHRGLHLTAKCVDAENPDADVDGEGEGKADRNGRHRRPSCAVHSEGLQARKEIDLVGQRKDEDVEACDEIKVKRDGVVLAILLVMVLNRA